MSHEWFAHSQLMLILWQAEAGTAVEKACWEAVSSGSVGIGARGRWGHGPGKAAPHAA